MAKKKGPESRARKEYENSCKAGGNPIKEKTLLKKLLLLFPERQDEIPDIVAKVIAEGEASSQWEQWQESPEPATVGNGGVALTTETVVTVTEPVTEPVMEPTTPPVAPPKPAKPSKAALNKAKLAEKARQAELAAIAAADADADAEAQRAEEAAAAAAAAAAASSLQDAPKKAKKKAKPSKKEKAAAKLLLAQQAESTGGETPPSEVSRNGDILTWSGNGNVKKAVKETAREAPSNSKVQELRAYMGAPNGKAHKAAKGSISQVSVLDRQLELLGLDDGTVESQTHSTNDTQEAVLFSADLLKHAPDRVAPQYALLGGSTPNPDSPIERSSRRMFLNTNIPFSAFICGVQGSGKSHTTSCLIENCMIRSSSLGVLKKPLSTLVLHLGEHSSSLNLRPSEAAFLSSPGRGMLGDYSQVSVTVLASPSNYPNLKALYSQMPNVDVRPFMLQPKHLNVGTMMALMSVDQTQSAPLYMGQVTKILREMASQAAGTFDYLDFRRRLERSKLDGRQVEFLNQRLDLLESFLDLKGNVKSPNFEPGKVTIIDLSCPFVDSNTACVLFNIGLGMFLQSDPDAGKVIVVDEAHKYMTDTPAAKQLTETLLAIIRQQRHYGVRVIISTQEPTITPRLIDLCSVTVIHRFFSPEWFSALRRHIAPVRSQRKRSRSRNPGSNGVEGDSDDYGENENDGNDETADELFRNISGLGTGEALVFAPSAILGMTPSGTTKKADKLFKMKMRKRVTWDGGKSLVCV